jgi:hypothetical protein
LLVTFGVPGYLSRISTSFGVYKEEISRDFRKLAESTIDYSNLNQK